MGERVLAHLQLVHRIVRQRGGIMAVFVPAGQAQHPLAQQVLQSVLDLPGGQAGLAGRPPSSRSVSAAGPGL